MFSTAAAQKPLRFLGFGLILASIGLLSFIFAPALGEEVRYAVSKPPAVVEPVDTQFGIVIPKIGANAKIIADVDPNNEKEYQQKLTQGIAHAKGTRWFLFAHSASNWLEANRYNAIFYLLSKLESGDEVDIYYQGKKLVYKVTGQRIVDATEPGIMTKDQTGETITLMTCWPAGTTLKRLIVHAKLSI